MVQINMVDKLADSLNSINVAEGKGLNDVMLRPASKILKQILEIFKGEGFIGNYRMIDEHLGGEVLVELLGKINKCRVIKPRFAVGVEDWEKWESRYLPAKELGLLIVSTSKGLMTHKAAKQQKIGGRLIAFVY